MQYADPWWTRLRFWFYHVEPVRVGKDYTSYLGVYVCNRRVRIVVRKQAI
jgi:hypothetical protein